MSSIDVARNFFARMDARDTSGALALVTSNAAARLNLDNLPTTLARLLLRSQASCKECAFGSRG